MAMPTVERRRALVPAKDTISSLAARAYAEAATQDASMRLAVDVIEGLRGEAAKADDAYRLARRFDAAVGQTVGETLLPVVADLRDRYFDAVADLGTALVVDAQAAGTDGMSTWRGIVAEALGEYRLSICARMTLPASAPDIDEDWRSTVAESVAKARVDEWSDMRAVIGRLLASDIWDRGERAPLLALASQIQTYIVGDLAAARRLADAAMEDGPLDARAIEALATCLHYGDRRDEAEELLIELAEREPDSGIAHSSLGRIAREHEELDVAEERLLAGIRQAPDFSECYTELLELYAMPQLFPERMARIPVIAAQARALDPDSAYKVDLRLGCAYRDNDVPDRAREVLTGAVRAEPGRAQGYVELATLHLKASELDRAREQLDRALSVDPSYSETAAVYAQVAAASDDLEAAVSWSRKEVELTIGNPGRPLATLAVRQHAAGDVEGAWRTAGEAVRADPNDWRLIDTLADIVAERWARSHDDVRRLYADFLDLSDGELSDTYFNLVGNAASYASDHEGAVEAYRSSIAQNPDEPVFHRNLARALRNLERFDEASSELAAAFALDQDETVFRAERAWILNARGYAAYRDGTFEDAREAYAEAVELAPDQAVLQSNLALALVEDLETGARAPRLERAVSALTKAQELTKAQQLPPDPDYGIRLARLQARLARVQRFGELIDVPADTRAITIEFADDLVRRVDAAQEGQTVIPVQIPAMRSRLKERLGFDVPGLLLRPAPDLRSQEYRVKFHGAVRAVGQAVPGHDCVVATRDVLIDKGLAPEDVLERIDPVTGRPCSWAPPDALDAVELDGLERLPDVAMLLRHVEDLVAQEAGAFFGLDAAGDWLDTVRSPRQPSRRTPDAARAAASRTLAASRALRACTNDGIRLDPDVVGVIDVALDELDDASADVLGVEAARRVRASMPERLPRGHQVPVPDWAEAEIASGGPLTASREHELLRALEPDALSHLTVTVVTEAESMRAYLQRLLRDRFDTAVGARLNVLTRAEAAGAARATRSPLPTGEETA
jgi:tetratricopeptide (TPR) repeat protein